MPAKAPTMAPRTFLASVAVVVRVLGWYSIFRLLGSDATIIVQLVAAVLGANLKSSEAVLIDGTQTVRL
jgi:hypothetical protein